MRTTILDRAVSVQLTPVTILSWHGPCGPQFRKEYSCNMCDGDLSGPWAIVQVSDSGSRPALLRCCAKCAKVIQGDQK